MLVIAEIRRRGMDHDRIMIICATLPDVAAAGQTTSDNRIIYRAARLLSTFNNKAWGPQAKIMSIKLTIARRCLACRAQRGPLGVLPKAKRPRGAPEGPNIEYILVST